MDKHPMRVALVFGGVSPEHEVSISSAAQVAAGLVKLAERRPIAVMPVYINREGLWGWRRWPAEAPIEAEILDAARWDTDPERTGAEEFPFHRALARLVDQQTDVAMLILHGTMGEDGRIQGALDLAGIAYTGSGAPASALALDKARSQAVLNASRLPIAPSACVRPGDAESAGMLIETLGLPCVVKPSLGGSSVGVTIVREPEALAGALERAHEVSDDVLVERFITGREFTCGLIEVEGELIALPVTEIIPPEGRYFDYEAKYTPGMTREVTPAAIPAELARAIQSLARAAHLAIGCRGFSRVDFIADPAPPTIIEINTIPGMTATSLLPQAAAAVGIDFPALLGRMLDAARHDQPGQGVNG